MGSKTLTTLYSQKVKDNLSECVRHLQRIEVAFDELGKKYSFPLTQHSFKQIVICAEDIAFSDQIIYRFSKLQDCMGAKLFKSVLLYQGENVNKPFLDILNQLEKIDVINVDDWFEIRDLRNEIAHNYEHSDEVAVNMLNAIYKLRVELKNILDVIRKLIK